MRCKTKHLCNYCVMPGQEKAILKTGKTLGDQVEILSGLNSKEPYIVSANGKLFNGAKVQVK